MTDNQTYPSQTVQINIEGQKYYLIIATDPETGIRMFFWHGKSYNPQTGYLLDKLIAEANLREIGMTEWESPCWIPGDGGLEMCKTIKEAIEVLTKKEE